jgi:NCS1 family nucleobase:cation symporter-1
MLYQNEGIYRYKAGINWRALATLLIVVPINLPGLINAIDSTVYIGNYRYFYRASWLTSFFISFFLYVILSKVFPPSDTLVDKTVESLDEDEGYEGHGEAVELNSWEKNVASPSPSNGTHDQPSKASKV